MVLDLQTLGVAVTSSAKALPQQCFLWVTLVSFPSLLGKWNMAAVGRWEDVGTHHNKTMENPELVALMHVCPCLRHIILPLPAMWEVIGKQHWLQYSMTLFEQVWGPT